MSLLLEALKKAELAKQNSLGANTPQLEEPTGNEISFVEPSDPPFRADPLPELTPPDSFLSDAPTIEAAPPPRMPEPPPKPAPMPTPPPVAAGAPREPVAEPVPTPPPEPPAVESQRSAARQVFEAKEVDYNPRRPFYITISILGLIGVGYAGYLWWELRPRPTVYANVVQNAPKAAPKTAASLPPPPTDQPSQAQPADNTATNPVQGQAAPSPQNNPPAPGPQPASAPQAAPQTPAAVAATQTTPAPQSPANAAPKGGSPSGVQSATAPSSASVPPAAGTRATASASTPAPPTLSGAAAAPLAAPVPKPAATPRPARLPIKVTPPTLQVNEVLENAYAALQRGDLARAQEGYNLVISREQNNRDALLGLAAIDIRNRDFSTAELRYLKLLELDPRDTHAHAGLIALQGNVDAVQSESRVKNLIASQPDATHLYFTLGNQYAAQSRWIEAQDAYFKAHSAEPENADYAYNLAVSLDQLRQRQLALEYYRRALALAGAKPAAFDRAQVEARVRDLAR